MGGAERKASMSRGCRLKQTILLLTFCRILTKAKELAFSFLERLMNF